jgi:hypothetical protein
MHHNRKHRARNASRAQRFTRRRRGSARLYHNRQSCQTTTYTPNMRFVTA